jgi:acyl carrier protein
MDPEYNELRKEFTPEQIKTLDDIIERFKNKPGGLIPVLEQAQELLGFLPVPVQRRIGRCLNLPLSQVYGVVTFYSFFTMEPRGKHTVRVTKKGYRPWSQVVTVTVGDTTLVEVTLEATLQGDLGAESIDFLDIVFRLEKSFGIKIPPGEMFPDNIFSDPQFVAEGKVTPAGLAKLKAAMPHVDFTEFEKDPSVSKMPELFKVETIVKYVQSKVQ